MSSNIRSLSSVLSSGVAASFNRSLMRQLFYRNILKLTPEMSHFHSILDQLAADTKVYPNFARSFPLQQQSFQTGVRHEGGGAHAVGFFFVSAAVIAVHHLATFIFCHD